MIQRRIRVKKDVLILAVIIQVEATGVNMLIDHARYPNDEIQVGRQVRVRGERGTAGKNERELSCFKYSNRGGT
jgi:hypothetical protein